MSDRGWILNLSAIAAAKKCIQIVQEELGVKLKLSHPQFVEMLHEYCELTDSSDLRAAYDALMAFAGDQDYEKTVSVPTLTGKVESSNPILSKSDSVMYRGKNYRRYDEQGREFRGLYRGGARYT